MQNKVKPGDTVHFVVEHRYYLPDSAAPRMEYLPVEGKVTEIIYGGYKQAKVRSVEDGIVKLHYFKVADFGKCFYSDHQSAIETAARMADRYDRIWSRMMGEVMRRPWGGDGA